MKRFSSKLTKCITLKTDAKDWKIYCLQVSLRLLQPGNFMCWGSEGVKSYTAKQEGTEGKEDNNNAQTAMC